MVTLLRPLLLAALLAALLALPACAPPASGQTSFQEMLTRPHAPPTAQLAYGAQPGQAGELSLPEGEGPFPVAVLIHGGCWRADLPGLALLTPMAEALRARGVAVWNVEYARLGGGGGYPRTFTDVGQAVDHLRDLAGRYPLDLRRVVLVGHSAGGHLALWAAGRRTIPAGDPLAVADPLTPRAVVSLGGVADLEMFRRGGTGACGETAVVPALVEGAAGDPFRFTSPAKMLPLGVRGVLITGERDPIVPPFMGESFVRRARAAGDAASEMVLKDAGHFEVVDPRWTGWKRIGDLIAAEAK